MWTKYIKGCNINSWAACLHEQVVETVQVALQRARHLSLHIRL